MAEVKIGLSQANKPSPLGYRRFMNATILCFIPMVTGLVQGIPMGDSTRNIFMLIIAALPVLLKGVGMILGNGQVYSPTDEMVDRQNQAIQDMKDKNNSSQ